MPRNRPTSLNRTSTHPHILPQRDLAHSYDFGGPRFLLVLDSWYMQSSPAQGLCPEDVPHTNDTVCTSVQHTTHNCQHRPRWTVNLRDPMTSGYYTYRTTRYNVDIRCQGNRPLAPQLSPRRSTTGTGGVLADPTTGEIGGTPRRPGEYRMNLTSIDSKGQQLTIARWNMSVISRPSLRLTAICAREARRLMQDAVGQPWYLNETSFVDGFNQTLCSKYRVRPLRYRFGLSLPQFAVHCPMPPPHTRRVAGSTSCAFRLDADCTWCLQSDISSDLRVQAFENVAENNFERISFSLKWFPDGLSPGEDAYANTDTGRISIFPVGQAARYNASLVATDSSGRSTVIITWLMPVTQRPIFRLSNTVSAACSRDLAMMQEERESRLHYYVNETIAFDGINQQPGVDACAFEDMFEEASGNDYDRISFQLRFPGGFNPGQDAYANSETGRVSVIPTELGVYAAMLVALDAAGNAATVASWTMNITERPSIAISAACALAAARIQADATNTGFYLNRTTFIDGFDQATCSKQQAFINVAGDNFAAIAFSLQFFPDGVSPGEDAYANGATGRLSVFPQGELAVYNTSLVATDGAGKSVTIANWAM